jgi:hypothetical protein
MWIPDVILDGTGAGEWYLRENTGGSDRKFPQYWRIETAESEVIQSTQRASDIFG